MKSALQFISLYTYIIDHKITSSIPNVVKGNFYWLNVSEMGARYLPASKGRPACKATLIAAIGSVS